MLPKLGDTLSGWSGPNKGVTILVSERLAGKDS